MSFKHNCTKFYLLTNKPVKFWNEETDETFEIKLPTLDSLYNNNNLAYFINFIQEDLSSIQKMINLQIGSHYEFIHLICSLSVKNKDFAILKNYFINALKLLNEKFEFKNILFIDKIVITPEIFEQILDIIFMSLDKEITKIKPEDDEFTRMEKEAKIRADRIRKNSKNKDSKGSNIEDIIAAILYEFSQYKIEDLMSMNLYTIYYLFRYVGKIANYEVSQIAAGNGLAKKHKYFIEK